MLYNTIDLAWCLYCSVALREYASVFLDTVFFVEERYGISCRKRISAFMVLGVFVFLLYIKYNFICSSFWWLIRQELYKF